MIQLLESIVNIITTLVEFIINTIQSLIALISQIPTYVSFLTSIILYLPPFVYPFVVACLSIIVVQYILNRKAD